ncbi:DUF397 domain-containing protein [Actinoplanes sp. GCM10030250]|uniref:DUF397 domain-containing protein n=1 Tax=Actinoplanes sp. GCM10030250 TaxID=3273376 RepID=UPI003617FA97
MEVKRQMASSTSTWTRSSFCADSACVEVAPLESGDIGLRDAKYPDLPHLSFGREDWHAFLDEVTAGGYRDI